jgi:uncharacterized protein (DUF302 family)
MSYYFAKSTAYSFDDAITRVTEALKKEGFGVLTEIDVKETLKKKLNVDFRRYKILGACNPPFAYQALQTEEYIGTMLPCNVIVQEKTMASKSPRSIHGLDGGVKTISSPQLRKKYANAFKASSTRFDRRRL